MPWLQNYKHIPSDFHKMLFWMIIQFPAIIHPYNQDYVDWEDDAKEVGYSLKNLMWGKFKIPKTKHVIYSSSALLLLIYSGLTEKNVTSSQRTLIWKDWDIFYLWRRDINLYLKNVVLASLYFSLEYLEERRSINHIL